jgi:hypothetical protein
MLPGLDPVFQGMVDMGGAEIGGEFYADKARFESRHQKVSRNAHRQPGSL